MLFLASDYRYKAELFHRQDFVGKLIIGPVMFVFFAPFFIFSILRKNKNTSKLHCQ